MGSFYVSLLLVTVVLIAIVKIADRRKKTNCAEDILADLAAIEELLSIIPTKSVIKGDGFEHIKWKNRSYHSLLIYRTLAHKYDRISLMDNSRSPQIIATYDVTKSKWMFVDSVEDMREFVSKFRSVF